jgi:phage/plasmid-associated DNA primase
MPSKSLVKKVQADLQANAGGGGCRYGKLNFGAFATLLVCVAGACSPHDSIRIAAELGCVVIGVYGLTRKNQNRQSRSQHHCYFKDTDELQLFVEKRQSARNKAAFDMSELVTTDCADIHCYKTTVMVTIDELTHIVGEERAYAVMALSLPVSGDDTGKRHYRLYTRGNQPLTDTRCLAPIDTPGTIPIPGCSFDGLPPPIVIGGRYRCAGDTRDTAVMDDEGNHTTAGPASGSFSRLSTNHDIPNVEKGITLKLLNSIRIIDDLDELRDPMVWCQDDLATHITVRPEEEELCDVCGEFCTQEYRLNMAEFNASVYCHECKTSTGPLRPDKPYFPHSIVDVCTSGETDTIEFMVGMILTYADTVIIANDSTNRDLRWWYWSASEDHVDFSKRTFTSGNADGWVSNSDSGLLQLKTKFAVPLRNRILKRARAYTTDPKQQEQITKLLKRPVPTSFIADVFEDIHPTKVPRIPVNAAPGTKPIEVFQEELFDYNDFLVGLPGNMIYDLRTNTKRVATPSDMVTLSVAVEPIPYETQQVSELFQLILEMNGNDVDKTEYTLKRFGFSLARPNLRSNVIFLGAGSNGKTVLLDWVYAAMGRQYSTNMHSSFIVGKPQTNSCAATPDLTMIQNKRLVLVNEIPANSKLNDARFKNISENRTEFARRLFCQAGEVAINVSMFIAANFMPSIDYDLAVIDRLVVIRFMMRYVDKPDPSDTTQLPRNSKLVTFYKENPQIMMALLLHYGHLAAVEYLENNHIEIPEIIKQETMAEAMAIDVIRAYMKDQINVNPEFKDTPKKTAQEKWKANASTIEEQRWQVSKQALWTDFSRWLKNTSYDTKYTQPTFNNQTQNYFERMKIGIFEKQGPDPVYVGIELRPEPVVERDESDHIGIYPVPDYVNGAAYKKTKYG